MLKQRFAITVAVIAATLMFQNANAAELKIAHFVTPKHSISQWIEKWAKDLEEKSNGELTFKIFPGAQLGPPPKYHALGKKGQADIVWMVHGFTPGLFPLSELSNLPYLFASGEAATRVLNNPELRSKFLDAEHKGLKPLVLMAHQPGQINMASEPIRTTADMKGKRIRFASATIKDFIAELGATPVGMPPTQIADAMQKGTLDGAFIDYGGAGLAFKLGPVTKYTTEMYSYVASMCICMNQRAYDKLAPHLQKMIDESVVGVESEIGNAWDKLDVIGRKMMVDAGTQPIRLSDEDETLFREAADRVAKAKIAELTAKNLPAQEVYDLMQSLATEANAKSKNFWKQ